MLNQPKWKSPSTLGWITTFLLIGFGLTHDRYETLSLGNVTYRQLTTPIVISQNDRQSYTGLQLANQMEVILISDPEAGEAGAALSVRAGSQDEPNTVPGLAHFLEHMLFRGSEKYPNVNEYRQYLKSRSGFGNANTKYETTNYHFGVSSNNLEGALDRFTQFFIAPLFKEETVEREAIAVDSEFRKNLRDDDWRIEQVKKNISNSQHPYSYFGTGSYDTLITIPKAHGIKTRDSLIEFYHDYYSADRMKLVVIGKESITELKRMVIPRFSKVPNHHTNLPRIPSSPFTKEQLRIQINIVPVSNKSTIALEFILPSQTEFYNGKPTEMILYLLRHKGIGSLAYRLESLGWISSNLAKLSEDHLTFAILSIEFDLTPLGLDHTDKIMKLTFSYIRLLRERGINKKMFDEINSLRSNEFRFKEKTIASSYSLILAEAMQSPAPLSQVVVNYNRIIPTFNVTMINDILNQLTPHNMRVTLVSPSVKNKGNLKFEPYYDTQHQVELLSESFIQDLLSVPLDGELKLPETNPYIPTNFNLVNPTIQSQYPRLLVSNSTMKALWYINGNVTIPKVSLNLQIKNNQWFKSTNHEVQLMILFEILHKELEPISYLANQAGLKFVAKVQYPGIFIQVEGFSDKSNDLIIVIVDRINHINLTQTTINLAKVNLIQRLTNNDVMTPVNLVGKALQLTLRENTWSTRHYLDSIENVKLSDINQFYHQDLSNGNLEMLVVGNLNESKSISLLNQINPILGLNPIPKVLESNSRTVVLEEGHNYVHQIDIQDYDELDSAVMFYLDLFPLSNPKHHIMIYLISQWLNSAAFDQLRQKEQLGYIVTAQPIGTDTRTGVFILIQSQRDPVYLESRIENLLTEFVNNIKLMTDEEFQSRIQSYRSSLADPHRPLEQFSYFYWKSIISGYYDFNHDTVTLDLLYQLTKSDLIDTIQTLVNGHPQRKKLSVHAKSPKLSPDPELKLSDCGEIIDDPLRWRENQGWYPYPRPL